MNVPNLNYNVHPKIATGFKAYSRTTARQPQTRVAELAFAMVMQLSRQDVIAKLDELDVWLERAKLDAPQIPNLDQNGATAPLVRKPRKSGT